MLLLGALVPHPPIIIREIGGEETEKTAATVAAMNRLAGMVKDLAPETVMIFSPHGPVLEKGLAVRGDEKLEGNLRRFGCRLSWSWRNDRELVEALAAEIKAEGLSSFVLGGDAAFHARARAGTGGGLDHGVLVPLSFLAETPFNLVATGMSLFYPPERQYALGIAAGRAIRKTGRRVVVLASGDLSHCLLPGAPAAYNPQGKEFDLLLVKLLRENRPEEIIRMEPLLVENAAECGYRTVLMLLGIFEGLELKTEVLSYEGPFGVGYAVAVLTPGAENPARRLFPGLLGRKAEELASRRNRESPPVSLARRTVENHLRGAKPVEESELPAELPAKAGVFVSIKKHGQLRGCIGTIFPVQAGVAEEIKANAVAAAFHDPRFEPVREDELEDLTYSVDILRPAEPVRSIAELDPKRYGVIVRKGRRSGLLLPNLEGIETPEEQVAIARRKAGIGPQEQVELERFEVTRYY